LEELIWLTSGDAIFFTLMKTVRICGFWSWRYFLQISFVHHKAMARALEASGCSEDDSEERKISALTSYYSGIFSLRFISSKLIGSSILRSATTARSWRSSVSCSYRSMDRSPPLLLPLASTRYCSSGIPAMNSPTVNIFSFLQDYTLAFAFK